MVGLSAAGPLAGGAGDVVLAGPGAGVAAFPVANVIDRPVAARATSPGDMAVTDGTVPVVIRAKPRWAGRGTGCLVAPGHTRLTPRGPSDALTVSPVAALTVEAFRLASLAAAAGGKVMARLTPVG